MIVNITACILGTLLIYLGWKNNLIKTMLIGYSLLLWDFLMIYQGSYISKKINNKYLFVTLFMLIPALIFAPILFLESFKYQDYFGLVKIFSIGLFLVDIWHACQSFNYSFRQYLLLILILIIILYYIRRKNPIHYDDLYPGAVIDPEILKKSKYLFVVPNFNNKTDLRNHPDWSRKLLAYTKHHNKVLALHGYNHSTINGWFGRCEFGKSLSQETIDKGFQIFKEAFHQSPKLFKAPCYNLNTKNENYLKKLGLDISGPSSIFLNKLYHTTTPDNYVMKLINKLVDLY